MNRRVWTRLYFGYVTVAFIMVLGVPCGFRFLEAWKYPMDDDWRNYYDFMRGGSRGFQPVRFGGVMDFTAFGYGYSNVMVGLLAALFTVGLLPLLYLYPESEGESEK